MYSRQHGLTVDSCGFSARAAGTSTGLHSSPGLIAFLGSSDRLGTAFSLTSSLQKERFLYPSSWRHRELCVGRRRKRKKKQNSEEDEERWSSPCSAPRCGRKLASPCVRLFRYFFTQDNCSPLYPFNEQKNRKLDLHRLNRVAGCWCHSRMQERGRDVLTTTHSFLLEKGFLLFKGFVFVGSVLLLGMLTLYAQAKAQAHLEKRVLPPIASIIGAYTGRSINFGKVQSISPLGLTLESCALGPQSEEFSCGELPIVEIRVRPLASIRRRQIVLDAVLVQPNMLICQKQDWSWLGIPTPTEKTFHRSSSEEGLDARTKARRLARDEVVLKLKRERDKAARRSAASGYVLRVEEQSYTNTKGVHKGSDWDVGGKESSSSEYSGGDSTQMSEEFDRLSSEAVKEEEEGSWRREGKVLQNDMPVLGKSLIDCRLWLDEHLVKPVPLFKHWRVKTTSNKMEGQRRNLDASASAARAFFERLDHANTGVEGAHETSFKEMSPVKSYASAHGSPLNDSKVVVHPLKSPITLDPILVDRLKMELGDVIDKPEESKEEELGNYGYSRGVTGRKNTLTLAKDSKLDAGEEHPHSSNLNLVSLDFLQDDKHADLNDERTDRAHGYGLEGSGGPEGHVDSQSNNSHKGSKGFLREEVLGNHVASSSSRIDDGQGSLQELASLSAFKDTRSNEGAWWRLSHIGKGAKSDDLKPYSDVFDENHGMRARAIADSLVAQAKSNLEAAPLQNWLPVTLDSVYIRDGMLMLLAYGDLEPRVMENVNGYVKLRNKYTQVDVHLSGKLNEWRTPTHEKTGGRLLVKVFADLRQQKWHVKLKGNNLFAPLLERLLEIPLDWSDGRASGELSIWASKGDIFPSLSGRLNVSCLAFRVWEAPAAFKDVKGTLFFQGQRLFLHNTSGFFGAVPLHVSGDMDLNPESGEYRLVCQVPNVEANVLMDTLKAQPPLFPVAGAIKAAVYCRGPLEAPVFAGSAEISKKNGSTILDGLCTAATEAVKKHEQKGAVAAFDRIPFSFASANFTFDTDNCVADLYGIRATLVDGGELRGAGNLWICPEGEVDPGAVNMDLSGQVFFDSVVQNYLPDKVKMPLIKLDYVHGDAKIQGSLLQPVFDIKWNAPEAKGAFSGVRGDINIAHEAITINSSAFTFDLLAKIHTVYPSHLSRRERKYTNARPPSPAIEGLDVDLRMRGFDLLGLASSSPLGAPSAAEGLHSKITGRAKFQGRVVRLLKVPKGEGDCLDTTKKKSIKEVAGVMGEVLLSGLKLNQFVVAPHLAGHMEVFPTNFKLNAVGRADEHLRIEFAGNSNMEGSDQKLAFSVPSNEIGKNSMFFSLERGQLRMRLHYQPGYSAKLEVRNLQLDELELASLRGIVQKAETHLNFQKRRGHGSLSVRRPRFSGVQGESLDLSCRWSGDVITIERSVLEQASSRYELQGEYVLPGPRDRAYMEREKGEGTWKTAMAGQLGSFITSLGRWRLQLEVPGAEVADMLPVARLLSRSSDPAVVSRSKELFMQGMQHVGFCMENLKQQLENIRSSEDLPAFEEGSQESVPLPGLAELKGHWHGNFEASGGGNGDTSADFDFHGDEWEWGAYKVQRVTAVGSYNNNDGLQLDKIFIQKDTATLHADGTLLGPKSTLHFAVLNFPIGLVPPLMHAIQSSTLQPVSYSTTRPPITSIRGILYMEGDLRGPLAKPQCDVQVRLLDGAIGGVDLGRAEVVASITSSNRFSFNAKFEPAVRSGHVYIRGSLPLEAKGLDAIEDDDGQKDFIKMKRPRGWNRNKSKLSEDNELGDKKLVRERLGDEGWEVQLAESLKELDWDFSDKGAVQVDATVKDGGMMLITALSPHLHWLQGNADLTLQVRGTVDQPTVDGVAAFHRVSISSPVLPRPLSNFGGTIRVLNNQLCVEGLEGRVGRKGRMHVRGKLPLRASESSIGDNIEWKADSLEVRAKNVFSGQVDSQIQLTGSLLEPVVSGMIKLSHGEAYLPQEKGVNTAASSLASSLSGMAAGGRITGFTRNEVAVLPDHLRETQSGLEDKIEEKREQLKSLVAVELKTLKLYLGPELRVVYPLILNFAVSGELELNGLADPQWIKPRGTLTFENGDVNLVATQVRLNRDHPNRAKFEPEQGLDPTLDLALVGADWQLKIQGRARNWQDNLVITSTRSGEPDALTRTEAARVFESQLADSLLEGNGQLAFKKLAAATVETLMPKIEGKGEFGQARWRLVSAPQIPNLLSLDPTTDPFRSLANLSFGTEVEVQLGKRLQASVVRQLKESEMATQWTLLYQLNNKLRILFSSIPSVDNRLLFEYSATSQN